MKNNKCVAVTGATGFVGAYLCRALIKKGFHVNAIDNNIRGKIDRLPTFKDKLKFYRSISNS